MAWRQKEGRVSLDGVRGPAANRAKNRQFMTLLVSTMPTQKPAIYGSAEYHEGSASYRANGEPATPCPVDCPYKKSDQRRAAWFLGWIDARTADCIDGWHIAPYSSASPDTPH